MSDDMDQKWPPQPADGLGDYDELELDHEYDRIEDDAYRTFDRDVIGKAFVAVLGIVLAIVLAGAGRRFGWF